ncbi:MAG: FtsX-like permease family protein [Thermoproteota archaeon]
MYLKTVSRLKTSLLLTAILLTILNQLPILFGSCSTKTVDQGLQTVAITNLFPINVERMGQVISTISSYGSRLTGYPGYYDTLEYLYNYLNNDIGIQTKKHEYTVVIPYEEETYIEVLEPYLGRIDAYALYPNGINPSPTPPEGIIGKLVYVGKGSVSDLDGKDIPGSIVAMDFNSRDNWLKVANLGAEAVIFIEPDGETNFLECYDKFLDTPIYFPRVYVKKSDWEILKNANKIRLVTRVSWREITASNIIGYINGTDGSSDVVILSAHFDSWSVVPRLASSKTELIPVALLLEYARYLANNPPKYNVWIVLYSGHWQALAGPREFVEEFFFRGRDVVSGSLRPILNINFDLMASDSDGLQILYTGMFSTYGGYDIHQNVPNRIQWFTTQINNMLTNDDDIKNFAMSVFQTNASSLLNSYLTFQSYWGTEPVFYMLDCEPVLYSGLAAFTITSRRSARNYIGSPIDDSKYANLTRLDPYLQIALRVVDNLLRMSWEGFNRDMSKPTRLNLVASLGFPGYATFQGQVKTYNFSKGWHDPVPNVLVEVSISTSTYKLNKIIVKADGEGKFVVHGIPPAGAAIGIGGGRFYPLTWVARGWVLDDKGTILMANDIGQFGMRLFIQEVLVRNPVENLTVVVSKVVPLEIFDFESPTFLQKPIEIDPRPGSFEKWRNEPWKSVLSIYELSSNIPIIYGYYSNGREPVAIAWVQPGTRFVVLSPVGLVLVNASRENTEGNGFYVEYGSRGRVCLTSFQVAKDIYYIAYGRYLKLVERNIGSPSAEETIAKTRRYLEKVEELLNEKKYGEAYSYALVARAYAYKAYRDDVMPLINDSGTSLLYLFVITIFGAFFLEKVIVHSQGSKRIISIGLLAALFLILFMQIHPAFGLMSNISLGMIGSLILILVLVTLVVLMAVGEEIRKGIERRVLGVHKAEVSRFDTAMMSFSIGSEHMRRRPLRAILVFLTMISMVIAMTSLTSLTPSRVTRFVNVWNVQSDFDQILIKQSRGAPPGILSLSTLEMVTTIAGDKFYVFPRVWAFGQIDFSQSPASVFIVRSAYNSTNARAILGLTSEEIVRKSSLFNLNTGGNPINSLLPEDAYHVIIPRRMADILKVTVGDTVTILGKEFKVVAIIEPVQTEEGKILYEVNNKLEADGWNLLPVDPQYYNSLSRASAVSAPGAVPQNIDVGEMIIMPLRKALEFGGYFASISVEPKEETSYQDMEKLAVELKYVLDLGLYLSYERTPKQLSTFYTVLLGGWEIMWLVIILGALNIFTTVLGSLKERTREVYIFSVVGLSPMGVTVFFMTEVIVYAIVGVLLGYVGGYLMTRFLTFLNIIPAGATFNFASTFTLLSTAVTIVAALAAAAYPSFIASRVATPSLERRWRFKTKPKGNEWYIPLLIGVSTVEESRGLLAYLHEYYEGMGAVKEGVHMVKELHKPDYENLSMSFVAALSPFELGVTQRVNILTVYNEETKRYEITLHLERLSGPENTWITSNYKFVDDLRKQLIVWGALSVKEKANYISKTRAQG